VKGPFERRGVHWWVSEEVEAASVLDLAEAALRAVEGGALANVKGGRRKALYRWPAEGDRPALLLKSNAYPGRAAFRRRLTGSKSRHELRLAEAVSARRIPTPTPWIVGEERRGPRLVRCWSLVPMLDGVVDLRAGVRGGALGPSQRRRLAEPFGAFAASLHAAGLDQDDFSPNNFLVRPGTPPRFWAIDFERARLGRPVPEARAAAQLSKLWRELTRTSRSERLRFLRGYAPGREATWAARLGAAQLARTREDWRRWSQVAKGDGRRFHALREAGLATWYRDHAPGRPDAADLGAAAGPARLEGRELRVPLGAAGGFDDWVAAHLLAFRELGPEPLALWRGASGACLLYRVPERARIVPADAASGPGEAAAIRVLEALLREICVWRPPGPRTLAMAAGPDGRPRALCHDPRGVRPRPRSDEA